LHPSHASAVDHVLGAGDVRRAIGDEERDQLADIGRPARRTQRDAAYRFHDLGAGLVDADVVDLSDLLGHAIRGLRLDVTRADGVYTNPIGGQLIR
jgi:hypothetical protein